MTKKQMIEALASEIGSEALKLARDANGGLEGLDAEDVMFEFGTELWHDFGDKLCRAIEMHIEDRLEALFPKDESRPRDSFDFIHSQARRYSPRG